MSEFKAGTVGWFDLTVPEARRVKGFYETVVGWKAHDHPMGEYADFDMRSPDGKTVTGVCHARGANADIPAQWMIYINVEDVEAAATRCVESGGEVVTGPRLMGRQPFCVIRDPAGAMAALVGPPQK